MKTTLVDAATQLLIERGWAATTAVAVCERANCTRGALMHHYPSLSALLASALESIYDDFIARAAAPPNTVLGGIDRLWSAISDSRFKAVFEAWLAAANDPELASEIAPAIARFAKIVAVDNARRIDRDTTAFVLVAREAMLGLAFGRATNGGKPLGHERIVIARLRDEAARIDRSSALGETERLSR